MYFIRVHLNSIILNDVTVAVARASNLIAKKEKEKEVVNM